jgi:hypothetical protein
LGLIKHYYKECSLVVGWNCFIKGNNISTLLIILFLVLILTFILTTLEIILKCKTKTLYNCEFLSNNNTKTNNYK